jgi:hypothetical protein
MINQYASSVVEKQMRNWELAQAQRPRAPETKRPEVEDFIAISRMVGVDALGVGEILAKKLGWPVFDREILDLMAGDDFDRRQIYASMDERDLHWSEENLRGFFDTKFVKNDYFHKLCETLLLLARKSPALFLGRGGDLLLPHDLGFRVRLVAPFERRVEWTAAMKGLPTAAARREVERLEAERESFYSRHFHVRIDDPLRFDMTINMDRFAPDQAAAAILAVRRIKSGVA